LARETAASGDIRGAAIECSEAMRLKPDAVACTSMLYPHGMISLADYYQELRQFGKAIEVVNRALQSMPAGDSEQAQALLHIIAANYRSAGDPVQSQLTSLRESDMAERLGRKPKPVLRIQMNDSLATFYEHRGDTKNAEVHFRKLEVLHGQLARDQWTGATAG